MINFTAKKIMIQRMIINDDNNNNTSNNNIINTTTNTNNAPMIRINRINCQKNIRSLHIQIIVCVCVCPYRHKQVSHNCNSHLIHHYYHQQLHSDFTCHEVKGSDLKDDERRCNNSMTALLSSMTESRTNYVTCTVVKALYYTR